MISYLIKQNLLVIPSIDIKDGKTVRVVKGIPELNCNEYGNDPIEMAMIWRAENAKCIHVVDFDSSHDDSHKNYRIIKSLCESVVIPVELGGGIRCLDDAKELFDLGAFRLVIGTLAVTNLPEFEKILDYFGPNKISSAIDVLDNEVMIRGRREKTGLDPEIYAKNLKYIGLERFIVTDVSTNGMLQKPNINLSISIANATNAKITLSGGVSGFQDLKDIQSCGVQNIDSVIIGRALYENKFPCQKIWRVAESGIFDGGY